MHAEALGKQRKEANLLKHLAQVILIKNKAKKKATKAFPALPLRLVIDLGE